MNREILKDNFNAILETSSLFGHDLSGQYHVIQFCLDELSERPLDEQTMRFIGRIGESLEELIRLTEQARRVFRESALADQGARSLREILELACSHYYVHAAKSWPALNVAVSGDLQIACSQQAQLYWYLVLPTLMARVQMALKNGNSSVIYLSIEKADSTTSGWLVKLTMDDFSMLGNLSDNQAFMGEREKRFAWGAQVMSDSLAHKGIVHCQQVPQGLVFFDHKQKV